jgi:hypothetical protein
MSRGLDTINQAGQGFVDRTRAGEVEESAAGAQGFMQQIDGLNTEQLEQARQNGTFAGNNVAGLSRADQGRVFSQLQGRDQAIAKEQANTFANRNAAFSREEAPEAQEIGNLIASERYTDAREMLAKSNIRDKTGLMGALESGNRSFNERALVEQNRQREIKGGQIVDSNIANNENQRNTNSKIIADARKEIAASTSGVSLDKDGNYDVSGTEFEGVGAEEQFRMRLEARTDDVAAETKGFGQALTDEQLGDRTRRQLSAAGITGTDQVTRMDAVTAGLASNSGLGDQAQARYTTEINQDNAQADAQFTQMESEHQRLVALNPTSPEETARLESTTLNSVRQLAMERAPQGSWMDGFSNAHGGEKLQNIITTLSGQSYSKDGVDYEVKPWMIESALMGSTQNKEEAWGNPTTDIKKFEDLVRIIATDPEGKTRKEKIKTSQAKVDRARLGVDAKKRANASNKLKQYKKDAKIVTGTASADAIIQRRLQRQNN